MFYKPAHLPDILTREEVLFSWALGEAYSPRWQQDVMNAVSDRLKTKLARGETVRFTAKEQAELITDLSTRRPWFISEYIDKSNHFRVMHFPSKLLGGIAVLPTFGWEKNPVSLSRYLKMESKEEWLQDPRQAAKKLMANPPASPYSGLPIVAYSDELKCDMLIDGYSRLITAIWRMEKGEHFPPVAMIYCERR